MSKVGAQRAADLTGRSKSTVQRAMKSGKLSFEIDENGQRLVDVSELERVFGMAPDRPAASNIVGPGRLLPHRADVEVPKADAGVRSSLDLALGGAGSSAPWHQALA